MIVLAIDAATSACSAALTDEDRPLAWRLAAMARGQSEALTPMLRDVLDEAGLGFADLDLLAVTVGPGAFTGLRIGLACARALALATGLPLAGVPTPLAVAAAVPEDEAPGLPLVVAVDSRRDLPWVQMFDAARRPLGPVAARSAAEIAALCPGPLLLAGDGAARLAAGLPAARLSAAPGWPDARQVARLGLATWRDGTALPPEPLYLRDADVTLPAGAAR